MEEALKNQVDKMIWPVTLTSLHLWSPQLSSSNVSVLHISHQIPNLCMIDLP